MRRKLLEVPNINLIELAGILDTPLNEITNDFKDILRREIAKQMPECFKKKRDVLFHKVGSDYLITENKEPYIFRHMTYHEAGKRIYTLLNEIKEDPMSKMEISYVYKLVIVEHMGQSYIADFE